MTNLLSNQTKEKTKNRWSFTKLLRTKQHNTMNN